MTDQKSGISLAGKRIIITGGARGMAAATVEAYVRAGALVTSLDRYEHSHSAIAGEDRVRSVVCDVSDADAVQKVFASAADWMSGIDILVNAAAIFPGNMAEDIPLEEWNRVFSVNMGGTVITNQAVFPYLKEKGGKILNFGSSSGWTGLTKRASYAASKGAVHGWSFTIAREWAKYGITVNIIAPAMMTGGVVESTADMTDEERVAGAAWLKQTVPLGGRLGDPPSELAPYMVFLASEGANFVTGSIIRIDGGMIANV